MREPLPPTSTGESHPTDPSEVRPIAAFDVDGTLTWADSYLLFLRFMAGRFGFGARMVRLIPVFLAYRLGLVPRHAVKEKTLEVFLKGLKVEVYAAKCDAFANLIYPLIARPDGLARLRAHQGVRDEVVLVSASLRDYLAVWARALGVDHVLATEVEVVGGVLTGRLQGQNCWGPGKLAAIRAAFGDRVIVAAYGDTRGDREMLAVAQKPGFRIFEEAPRNRLSYLLALYAGNQMERMAANRL